MHYYFGITVSTDNIFWIGAVDNRLSAKKGRDMTISAFSKSSILLSHSLGERDSSFSILKRQQSLWFDQPVVTENGPSY